jgi:division protein 1
MPDTTTKQPPIIRKRSTSISTSSAKTTATTAAVTTPTNTQADNRYIASTQAVISAAKDKANSVVHSAREWLTPSSEWTPSFSSHLDSLSTVMFSPLAAHPVYRSESMVKALQLMQQQQSRQAGSSSGASSNALISPTIATTRTDLILHGTTYAWPSSAVLLQADIPESSSPVSLFQGFASAYPSLAKASLSPRRTRQRRKKMNSSSGSGSVHPRTKDLSTRSVTQIISEREKRVRDCDKISMQKVLSIERVFL